MRTFNNNEYREELKNTEMPTIEAVYDFIKNHYKHDRFEGRNGSVWGENYSQIVAESTYEYMELHGFGGISQYENIGGCNLLFDRKFNIIN